MTISRNLNQKVDESVRRTLVELSAQIDAMRADLAIIKSMPSNGNAPLSAIQIQQVSGLIAGRSQAVIGIDVQDPVLPGQVGAVGSLTNLSANNSVSGLTMTISNPLTTPIINLSGTPNIAGSNITSGTINTARLPATINIATAYQIGGIQVVGARNTGWNAWTGTATKTSFDTTTATLTNVAEAVKALFDLVLGHGLAGS